MAAQSNPHGDAPTPEVVHLSVAERVARGRAARSEVPRSSHAGWEAAPNRADPVALLKAQEEVRVEELVPIRHERMLASAFAFYRGAAVIMAADLASGPQSGLRVQAVGDAHLANFGGFAAPDRQMVFDINDFDETTPGPFEWDVKRLAASFEIAARSREFSVKSARTIVSNSVRAYREAMASFAAMTNLDVWYARLDVEAAIAQWSGDVTAADVKRLQRNVTKAQGKDSLKALNKLTEVVDGEYQIRNDPPLVVRVAELFPDAQADQVESWLHDRMRVYRRSLQPDRRHLLEGYRLVDFARKVVGVGSVGTRCWIALMMGKDDQDPLFLQIKEAEASVLEPYAGKSGYASHGQRVVEGQRLLQAASDVLLGWTQAVGLDGVERDFYIRQLWDWKLSADLETMPEAMMKVYAQICGWTLARGHARSGDRIAIASYLGGGDVFDRAIADFSASYADQNQRDFEAAQAAGKAGVIEVAATPVPA
jgi:uncharacterized protein (DUF2252 family)